MERKRKPIREKTFSECTTAELIREAKRQTALKTLKCPECGEGVLSTHIEEDTETVVFKCMFSATFDRGVSPEDAQKKLDEFKSSGKMLEWLKEPWF